MRTFVDAVMRYVRSAILLAALLVAMSACAPAERPAARATEPLPSVSAPTKAPTTAPSVAPTAAPTTAPTAVPTATPAALTFAALGNAEYPSQLAASKKARLVDGKYEEVIVPGSASKISVALQPIHALGDLNGDGVGDAAVVLVESGGGSGSFYSLVAVLNQGGTPKAVASTSLGDRPKVENVTIEAGTIRVDMLTHGQKDPMCCPTQWVSRRFRLQGDGLVAMGDTPVAIAGQGIVGVAWKWERFNDAAGKNDIVVDDPSRYTLTLQPDGSYRLRADCNQVTGQYTLQGSSLTLAPGATTLVGCPAGSLDSKFLARLGAVATYVLRDGRLVLNLKMDGGDMVFRGD